MANNEFEDFDDLNFDDFGDTGEGDWEGEGPKNDRNPAMTIAGGFVDGIKSNLLDPATQMNAIRSVLPAGYKHALDTVDSAASNMRDMYDYARQESKPVVKELKKGTRLILKRTEQILPAKIAAKLKEWSKEEPSYSSAKINVEDTAINSDVGGIFNAHMIAQKQREDAREANQTIKDIGTFKQNSISIDALYSVADSTRRLVDYQDQVAANFQRKSLELQYRHYFVSRKLLDTMEKHLDLTKVGFETVGKNTGLPDMVKYKASEHMIDQLKTKIFGNTTEPMSQWYAGFGKRLITKQKAKIKNFFSDAGTTVTDAVMMGETMQEDMENMKDMLGEEEFNNARLEMGGGAGGNWLSNKLIEKAIQPIRDKIAANGSISAGNYDLMRKMVRAPAQLRGLANDNSLAGFGFLGSAIESIQEAAGRNTIQTAVQSDGTKNNELENQAYFRMKSQRTLEEVIPGWLSKMHRELKVIATKNPAAEQEHFNFETAAFETEGELRKKIRGKVVSDNKKNWAKYYIDQTMKHIDPTGTGLTGDARKAMVGYVSKLAFARKDFDPALLVNDLNFPRDSKLAPFKSEIISHMKMTFGFDDDAEMDNEGNWKDDPFGKSKEERERLYHLSERFATLSRELPDSMDAVLTEAKKGRIGLLQQDGIVTLDEATNTYHLNREKILDLILGDDKFDEIPNPAGPTPPAPPGGPPPKRKRRTKAEMAAAAAGGSPPTGLAHGGMFDGKPMLHRAEGDLVEGPGSGANDTINAQLANREFIMNAGSTGLPGMLPLLRYLNSLGNGARGINQDLTQSEGISSSSVVENAIHKFHEDYKTSSSKTNEMLAELLEKGGGFNVNMGELTGMLNSGINSARAGAARGMDSASAALDRAKNYDYKAISDSIKAKVASADIAHLFEGGMPDIATLRKALEDKVDKEQLELILKDYKQRTGELGKKYGSKAMEGASIAAANITSAIAAGQKSLGSLKDKLTPMDFEDISEYLKSKDFTLTGLKNKLEGKLPEADIAKVLQAVTTARGLGSAVGGAAGGLLDKVLSKLPGGFKWLREHGSRNTDRGIRVGGAILGFGLKIPKALLNNQLDKMSDIYVKGEDKPRMKAVDIKAGKYMDPFTRKIITSVDDITGPVTDLQGNEVISAEDFALGFTNPYGKTILENISKRVKGLANMAMAPGRGLRAGISNAINKLKEALDAPEDVYVKGEMDKPRLYKTAFEAGAYRVKGTGDVIAKLSDIKGEIVNKDGQILLSFKDLETGLVDSKGEPFRTMGGMTFNLAKTAAKLAAKAAVKIAKVGKAGFDKLVGVLKSGGSRVASLAGKVGMPSLGVGSKAVVAKLDDIYKLLQERLAKSQKDDEDAKKEPDDNEPSKDKPEEEKMGPPNPFDSDGDGDRDGSAKDQAEAKAKAAAAGEEKSRWSKLTDALKSKAGSAKDAVSNFSIMDMFKKIPMMMAAAGTLITSTVASAGKVLSFLKGAGGLVGKGLGLVGKGLWGATKLVGRAGMGLLRAAPMILGRTAAILTGPVGIALTVAYVGYKLYKHYNKPNTPINRFRISQYGFKPDDEEHAAKLITLEQELLKVVKASPGQPATIGNGVTLAKLVDIFGVNMDDKPNLDKWVGWFSNRFKPIFLAHVTELFRIKGKTEIDKVDTMLMSEDKKTYLQHVHNIKIDKNPYSFQASPFNGEDNVQLAITDVNDAYDTAIKYIESHAKENDTAVTAGSSEKPKPKKEEKSWWESTKDTAKNVAASLGVGVSTAYNNAVDGTSKLIGGGAAGLAALGGGISSMYNKAVDATSNAMTYTADTARSVVSTAVKAGNAAVNRAKLYGAMLAAGITKPIEQAMFLAQMHTESGGFKKLEENLNYKANTLVSMFSAAKKVGIEGVKNIVSQGPAAIGNLIYGGRMGNNAPGEGYKYRGRGFTQLTGKENYTSASRGLGIDLVNNPDWASDPEVAGKIATWYWKTRVKGAGESGDVLAVTKRINGGTHGLSERKGLFAQYQRDIETGKVKVDPGAATPAKASAVAGVLPPPSTTPAGKAVEAAKAGNGPAISPATAAKIAAPALAATAKTGSTPTPSTPAKSTTTVLPASTVSLAQAPTEISKPVITPVSTSTSSKRTEDTVVATKTTADKNSKAAMDEVAGLMKQQLMTSNRMADTLDNIYKAIGTIGSATKQPSGNKSTAANARKNEPEPYLPPPVSMARM